MNIRLMLAHATMLEDATRMRAYDAAIREVCPGRVVCEVGLGFGPLSLMALRAGAKRVYGIEADPESLEVATQVIRANGFDASRFVPIHGLSTEVELPERAEVLLSETLDSMGVGENTALFMRDARTRLMTADAVFLPARLDCHAALATPEAYRTRAELWNTTLGERHGLDYRTVGALLRRFKQTLAVKKSEVRSGWERWQRIDFATPASYRKVSPVMFVPTEPGVVEGLAFAFDAMLSPSVNLRTRPDDAPTHWMQGFQPFPEPVVTRAGDVVYVEIVTEPLNAGHMRLELHVASGPMNQIESVVRQRLSAFQNAAA